MKTFILLFVFILCTVSLLSFSGNGSGTEEDPYQITNVQQLQEMNDDLDAHYILMNDIDASETREWNVGDHDGDSRTTDSAMGFEPVGTYEEENPMVGFTGSLDGKYFTIYNLFINRPAEDNVGLFGFMSGSTRIKSVIMSNADITAKDYTGILIGRIETLENSNIYIDSCSTNGIIRGDTFLGGFIGFTKNNEGRMIIKNSLSNVEVYGIDLVRYVGDRVGGFCGESNGAIYNCKSSGYVEGDAFVGGFCGINGDTISNCESNCTVKANQYVGGFCGRQFPNPSETYDSALMIHCISKGNVYGIVNNGGFCGANSSRHYKSNIDQCISIGEVTGKENTGGFCGWNGALEGIAVITNSFCTGNVIVSDLDYKNIAGFCGVNYVDDYPTPGNEGGTVIIENSYTISKVLGGTNPSGFCASNSGHGIQEIVNCYYDTQTSGTTVSDGGEGKTTEEMKLWYTFEGWNFDTTWCIGNRETYPQLQHFVDCDTLVSVPKSDLNSELMLYPNPTDNALYIEFDSGFIHSPEIAIYNQLGQIVFSDPSADITQPYKVNTGNFPPGIYFCKVSGNGISEVRSFVVYR
jgi:hypothetical protein